MTKRKTKIAGLKIKRVKSFNLSDVYHLLADKELIASIDSRADGLIVIYPIDQKIVFKDRFKKEK